MKIVIFLFAFFMLSPHLNIDDADVSEMFTMEYALKLLNMTLQDNDLQMPPGMSRELSGNYSAAEIMDITKYMKEYIEGGALIRMEQLITATESYRVSSSI